MAKPLTGVAHDFSDRLAGTPGVAERAALRQGTRMRFRVLAMTMLVGVMLTAAAPTTAHEAECDGPYKEKEVSPEELASVLAAHKKWLKKEADGQKANLCGAKLGNAFLQGVALKGAQLQGADLGNAHLGKADLGEAQLQGAKLGNAFLQEVALWGAQLQGADLQGAQLQGANLQGAQLQGAKLVNAFLQGAALRDAHLQGADLQGAQLQKADLMRTHLEQAYLEGAQLQGAELRGTNLQNAVFTNVDLTNARYAPSSAPDRGFLGGIRGLRTVRFDEGQHSGLVLLRATLKEAGLRGLEREATYALETQQTAFAPGPELYFRRLLFEWPVGYGLYYGRPLKILLWLIPGFALVYLVALRARGEAGIWVVWPTDRIHKHAGEETPRRLTQAAPFPPQGTLEGAETANPETSRCTEFCTKATTGRCALCDALAERDRFLQWVPAISLALYFSLLSAFHIGWRELNVGTWITRLQPREYTLRATGWVRVVSGLQSLISVYLLALWALTYFGRLFE